MEATPAAGIAATSAATSAAPTRRYYALPSHSLRLPAVTNASAAQQGTHRAPASTATELLTNPSSDESGAATSAVKPTPRRYVLSFCRVTKPAATAQQQAEPQEQERRRKAEQLAEAEREAEQRARDEEKAEQERQRARDEVEAVQRARDEVEAEQARQRARDEVEAEPRPRDKQQAQKRQRACDEVARTQETALTELRRVVFSMFIPARGRAARIQELTKALQNPRADRESELFGQANFLLALHEAQQGDRGWTEVAALLRGATERQSRLIDACTAAGEVRRAERLAAEQRQVQQATLAARRAAECAEQAELARQCLKLSASGCIPDLAAAVQRASQAGAECCVPQSVLADAKLNVAAVEAALSTGAAVVDADGDLGAPPIVTEQLARAVCNCKAMEARGSLIVEVAAACSVGDRVLQVREALRD